MNIKKLLSLPINLVSNFHQLEQVDEKEWFCTSDPEGKKLGSGGGTAWLLEACREKEAPQIPFSTWLEREKRILLHAGGQSRRLPAYAPSGKILTPIPVFRWSRGQRLNQNLLQLQLPLYEQIMGMSHPQQNTLIASGDVYIRTDQALQPLPMADVVCYGLWVDPVLAGNHGVFVSKRETPERLDYMLQKPSQEELSKLSATHLYTMDIGIWVLSDKAVSLLMKRCGYDSPNGITNYDLYSQFGYTLGENPKEKDLELNSLSVAILALQDGQFYHYGTSRELISSTLAVQNLVQDQRSIMHYKIKPHPAMFVQNADLKIKLQKHNSEVWIENSYIGSNWELSDKNIVTGIPVNDWTVKLTAGICLDIVPIGETSFALRPYGFNDPFKGGIGDDTTLFLGQSLNLWFSERGIDPKKIELNDISDIQSMRLFPLTSSTDQLEKMLRFMIEDPNFEEGKTIWLESNRLSADEISAHANMKRLYEQRQILRAKNWETLAENFERSVFYQLDLSHAAQEFANHNITPPEPLPENAPLLTRIHNHMFKASVQKLQNQDATKAEEEAFSLLKEGLINSVADLKQSPILDVYRDQIVWARSPVRIDLAGGWTDTPPYSLMSGGNVVNLAIELNGQPPLQVYVKPSKEYKIVLRSIDLGAMEEIKTFEDLELKNSVGSPFSIPKAALQLSGFLPRFSQEKYNSLEHQLKEFGSGIEITLLAAIPAGSGLGTSSILASTVLGSLSDFCNLKWDKNEVCRRTLLLEQLLTTGGGWQDQYGGVFQGIKLLETKSGFDQTPTIRWAPHYLFTSPQYKECHLLYYTGVTRTAKNILAEIVRGMFLNSTEHISLLKEMKDHALQTYEAIQRENFNQYAAMVAKTWEQNKRLDSGTNPLSIEQIINRIKDYCLGYKLPGAGGGGYLYIIAKDPEAALFIRRELTLNPPNPLARFVEMTLSEEGLEISRS